MPLDATRMVDQGHLIHDDILQFVDLFTGVMTDQPVTFNNSVFAASLDVGGTLDVYGGPSTFLFGAIMSNGAWQGPGAVPPGGAAGQVLMKNTVTDYDLTWGAGGGGGANIDPWYVDATTKAFLVTPDNTYDIGAFGANRPRNVIVGTMVVLPAGASGSPSLNFAGAPLTGIYQSGLNELAISSVGNMIVKIAASAVTINQPISMSGDGNGSYAINIFGSFKNSGISVHPTLTSTSGVMGIQSQISVAAGVTTADGVYSWLYILSTGVALTNASLLHAAPSVLGTNTVANMRGVYAENMGASGVTNAYGVYIAAQSGASSTNIGLYNAGTTQTVDMVGIGGSNSSWMVYVTALGTVKPGQGALYVTGSGATFAQTYTVLSTSWAVPANTSWVSCYSGYLRGGGSAWTLTNSAVYRAETPSLGSTTQYTNIYGVYIDNQGWARSNNAYGVYIVAPTTSTSTNMGLYNGGTTQLVGNIGIIAAPQTNAIISCNAVPSPITGSNQYGLNIGAQFTTTATNMGAVINVAFTTVGSYSMSSGYGIYVTAPVFTASVFSMYGIRIGNQSQSGANITNAYGIYIDTQSGASSNNIAIGSYGPNHFFNGRCNIGGTGAGDNHYYITLGSTPPSSTLMPTGDQTGMRLEYWSNGNCTGAVVGFFAAVLGGAGVQTAYATAIQAGNPGNQGGGIQNSTGIRIDPVTSGINNNYGLWVSTPSGASGDNFAIVVGGRGNRIRNPKNDYGHISIESEGYVMIGSQSGSHLGSNTYWDGSNWQRFGTSAGAYYCTTAGGFQLYGVAAGGNPITAWSPLMNVSPAGDMWVLASISSASGSLYLGPGGATANIVWQSAGNLLVMNNLTAQILTTSNYLLLAGNTTVSGAIAGVVYYHSNMTVYSFLDGGNGYHYANLTLVATGFTPTSARKLKTNIVTLDDPLSLVLDDRVHGVRYTEIQSGKPKVGFVADDWVGVEPSVVSFDHNDEVETLDYDRISAITFEALKQHVITTNARLEALERKLAA